MYVKDIMLGKHRQTWPMPTTALDSCSTWMSCECTRFTTVILHLSTPHCSSSHPEVRHGWWCTTLCTTGWRRWLSCLASLAIPFSRRHGHGTAPHAMEWLNRITCYGRMFSTRCYSACSVLCVSLPVAWSCMNVPFYAHHDTDSMWQHLSWWSWPVRGNNGCETLPHDECYGVSSAWPMYLSLCEWNC